MKLSKGAHIHLIGICGTAMASLAGLLKAQGYKVTGSDQNVYPPMSTQLQELGIQIQQGYRKENLEPRPDLVIVGNVITRVNEEAQALLNSDIPYTSLPKAMGEFAIADRECIVIAGTHGKTTTTSMMTWAADSSGHKPGFMIGGIPENYGLSFRVSQDNYFIIEGDEYDTAFFDKVPKFIHYKPKYAILTSVEFDHADIYADLDAVKSAFRRLMELMPADGILIANMDDANVRELSKEAKCKVVGYGITAFGDATIPNVSTHYQVVERAQIAGRNHFAVALNGQKIADIALKSPGEYNAMNATAVFALAHELKWNLNQVLQGFATFKGVKRRQQVLGSPGGVTIIEDFAHHPTAVKVTMAGVREQYVDATDKVVAHSKPRLFALFEPRSATSRRKIFQKDYVQAFQGADFIFIAKPYDQSKISEGDRFSSEELVGDIVKSGKVAKEFVGSEAIVAAVKAEARKGDVVLVMSNGAFDGIYQKLLAAL